MSASQGKSNHDEALAAYLDELLNPESAAIMAPESAPESEPESELQPEPGILLPCGRVLPDDDRHYVFAAGGLELGVPAVRVHSETAFEGALGGSTDSPVQTLALPSGAAVPVIDLVRLMLPPSAPACQRPLAERASTLVLLDGGEWAMVGEGPGRLELLDAAQICWRGDHATRTWLAGTLASRRLVLLDLDAVAGLLP
ncbi:MAG TPA: hypothetical protein VKO38_03995 [Wenzhouxiangella sp.]|nr:hypothetical protein [Wenzhouxiangella sp.]